jgi:hypothetical protein
MSWTAPKIDWASNNVLSSTEFNNIGANLTMLGNTFEVSASATGANESGTYHTIHSISVSIANQKKLVLRRYRGCFTSTASPVVLPLVLVVGETVYNPWAAVTETTPDFDLYTNTSGSTALKTLTIRSAGSLPQWDVGSACHLTLEIVDI